MVKIFGVVHDNVDEPLALPSVQPFFRAGSTLYVEHVSLFPLIVRAAKQARMRVISLDSKYARKLLNVSYRARGEWMKSYISNELRERSWLSRVKRAKEKDLVVLFPDHALAVIDALKIPKEDIPFMQEVSRFWIDRMYSRLGPKESRVIAKYIKEIRRSIRNRLERWKALESIPDNRKEILTRLRKSRR